MNCSSVEDFSPLTNNYRLELFECDNIFLGWEAIRNVYELATNLYLPPEELLNFNNLLKYSVNEPTSMNSLLKTNFPISKSLRNLTLKHDELWRSLLLFPASTSSKLFSLALNHFSKISNLSFLGSIAILKLEFILNLQDISSLGKGNKSVSISKCHQITDFNSLKNVQKVIINDCSGFTNGYDVENVKDLELRFCRNLVDVSMLTRPRRLVLQGDRQCVYNYSLTALKDIPILELFFYGSLSLPPLGLNEKIICSDCFLSDPLLEFYQRNDLPGKFPISAVFLKKGIPNK